MPDSRAPLQWDATVSDDSTTRNEGRVRTSRSSQPGSMTSWPGSIGAGSVWEQQPAEEVWQTAAQEPSARYTGDQPAALRASIHDENSAHAQGRAEPRPEEEQQPALAADSRADITEGSHDSTDLEVPSGAGENIAESGTPRLPADSVPEQSAEADNSGAQGFEAPVPADSVDSGAAPEIDILAAAEAAINESRSLTTPTEAAAAEVTEDDAAPAAEVCAFAVLCATPGTPV